MGFFVSSFSSATVGGDDAVATSVFGGVKCLVGGGARNRQIFIQFRPVQASATGTDFILREYSRSALLLTADFLQKTSCKKKGKILDNSRASK